jgi:hypothetical protein
MQRRHLLAGAAGAASLAMSSHAQTPGTAPAILELRYFKLRNTTDNQRGRLTNWLIQSALPALRKAGSGPVGVFASSIAPDAPFLLAISSHASLAVYEQTMAKLMQNDAFLSASEAFFNHSGLPFQRMETHLLRAFAGFPSLVVPPAPEAGKPPRLFELRIYESNSPLSLMKKIGMFENGEIEIFQKTGLPPVFFGETIVGDRMPNLTYMVWHDSLTARENNWRTFVQSPEWKKLSATPGLSDGEIVSNITTYLLSPVNGSEIR